MVPARFVTGRILFGTKFFKERAMTSFGTAAVAAALCAALSFGTAGCTGMNRTQQGVLSGTAAGALAGAGISAIAGGSGTMGALIGGGLGALAGGIYGHEKDR